jgi:hypothetical protein
MTVCVLMSSSDQKASFPESPVQPFRVALTAIAKTLTQQTPVSLSEIAAMVREGSAYWQPWR